MSNSLLFFFLKVDNELNTLNEVLIVGGSFSDVINQLDVSALRTHFLERSVLRFTNDYSR